MGASFSYYATQLFPPKPQFSADEIPDLSGKVVIVTGANAGIGKETSRVLLTKNAKVYLAARSQEKTEQAIQELKEKTGKEGIYLKLDLADLKSIKAAAEEFLSKEKELHILFNNAGVMLPPVDLVTAQGYDLQFGTNVLGHWYFSKLLLPTLISTAKSTPNGTTRIITTSSFASTFGKIDFNTFKDGPARRKIFFPPNALYGQSKLGNIIVSNEFARRYSSEGVISAAVNPGTIKTDLYRHVGFLSTLIDVAKYPVTLGALTQLWAGTTGTGSEFNGKYLIPWARFGVPTTLATDQKLGEELWKWLEEQVENV